MKRFIILLGLLMIMPLQAVAEIVVEDAWVRLPPPVADTAAGYMTIHNYADQDVEITNVTTAIATNPEFHAMEMHNGMMHMQKMEKVVVPAHGGISFDPGGNHLMLVGLTRTIKTGEHLMITLETSDGQSIMVHAEVRDMRSNNKHDDQDSDDDSHGHHGMHH